MLVRYLLGGLRVTNLGMVNLPVEGNDGVESVNNINCLARIIVKNVDGKARLSEELSFLPNIDRCIPKMDHHCPWT